MLSKQIVYRLNKQITRGKDISLPWHARMKLIGGTGVTRLNVDEPHRPI